VSSNENENTKKKKKKKERIFTSSSCNLTCALTVCRHMQLGDQEKNKDEVEKVVEINH
jgi:hypothetical protein